jgi:uncharacterized membrane protein YgaE (UPF0421/DUF939 family)
MLIEITNIQEGKFMLYSIGVLISAFGSLLAYIKHLHSKQIDDLKKQRDDLSNDIKDIQKELLSIFRNLNSNVQ